MKSKNLCKTLQIVATVLLVASFLTACGRKAPEQDAPAPNGVKVGVILNLTGASATVDGPKKKAMEVANEYLREHAAQGSPKIDLVFEDGKSTAKDSLGAYNNLARQGVNVFLVGSSLSAMPVCPINKDAGGLLFGVSGHPDFTTSGGLTVRCYPNVEQSANIIVGKLIPQSVKTIYILHMEEPWTKSYADVIRTKLGERVKVLEDAYAVGKQDFKDIVARIKNANPDQIILLDYGTSMQAIIKTLIENQVTTPIIGCETSYVADLPSVAGFDQKSFVFLASDYTERVAAGKEEFANYYKQREQGSLPPYYAVFCADGLAILSQVLSDNPNAASNPQALHDAIVKKRTFTGFSGELVVKPTGDLDYPIAVYKYENGLLVRVP